MKIFIVEDSEEVRSRLIEAVAEVDQVEVVGYADSEREAIEGILEKRPALVVLDLQLRNGSGLSVLRILRQFSVLTKIIVLTNHSETHYLEQCMAIGADYFFDKATEFMKVPEVLGGLVASPGRSVKPSGHEKA